MVLPDYEIDEHLQAIERGIKSLREWRDKLQSGEAAEDVPEQPEAPAN